MRRTRSTTIGITLVILGIEIAIAATRLSFLQGTPPEGSVRHDPARLENTMARSSWTLGQWITLPPAGNAYA